MNEGLRLDMALEGMRLAVFTKFSRKLGVHLEEEELQRIVRINSNEEVMRYLRDLRDTQQHPIANRLRHLFSFWR